MFVGRERELKKLEHYTQKKTASLLVIKGRRRIGKSTLIKEFAKNYHFYKFSGIPPTPESTAQSQRDEFLYQMGSQIDLAGLKADDWTPIFILLAQQVNAKKGTSIILLDEISWMGSKDPDFLGKLKNAWDIYLKKNDQLIVIICGSASSWIQKNIISSTGFLGRVSFTLTLDEIPLKDAVKFWGTYSTHISPFEKLKILSVTGGVPKYLEEIDPKQPAEHNINRLCFQKGGLLVNEFNNIFSDLFLTKSLAYKKIVICLAEGAKEATEISKNTGIAFTGRLTTLLQELELAGFITHDFTFDIKEGKDTKLTKYRLCDNYLRFYLKYIDKNMSKINKDRFSFSSCSDLPGWGTIMGLQFENLVLNNRQLIHEELGILPHDIIADNPYFQHTTKAHEGCQIDYLIQVKFGTLYPCEIKCSKNPIGTEIIAEMKEKLKKIKLPRGMSMRPTLIHINGVTEDVIDARYFAHIIDYSKFLK